MPWVRWTDKMDNMVMACRAEGKTAAAIASLMAVQFDGAFTRNMILGRANRIGMPLVKNDRNGRPRKHRAPRKRRPYKPRGPRVTLEEAAPPEGERIAIMELNRSTCHFVIDETNGLETQYCGRETLRLRDIRQPYCQAHFDICHDSSRDPKGSRKPSKFNMKCLRLGTSA